MDSLLDKLLLTDVDTLVVVDVDTLELNDVDVETLVLALGKIKDRLIFLGFYWETLVTEVNQTIYVILMIS